MGVVGTAVETSTALSAEAEVYSQAGKASRISFDGLPGWEVLPTQIVLGIINPTEDRAPCAIEVNVTGTTAFEAITFSIDGDPIWTSVTDADGGIDELSIDVPGDLQSGSHIVTATGTVSGSGNAAFELLYDPLPAPLDSLDAEAQIVPDSESKWVFQDLMPGGLGSWVLDIGPATMTHPHFERTTNTRHTTAVNDGQFHVVEGLFLGRPWRLQGTYLDEDFYRQLLRYAQIRRRFYVIDHRGRAWKVGIVSLTTEPRRYPNWIGTWVLDLIIYDQAPSVPGEAIPILDTPAPPDDPEVPDAPPPAPEDPPPPPPETITTYYGACPAKPGGESLSAALTVSTKWGPGVAVRQFKTNLSNPSVSPQFGIVHTSYKPNVSSVLSGSLDATIRSIANATPAGHVLEIWHEVDKKVRDGVDTRARLVAAKNRFYDVVKSVRPDVLIANTLTGWELSPTNSRTHGNIDNWADIRADLLGVDCDGIVPTTLPYTNYVDEINVAVDFVDRFGSAGYIGWSVPEFGCPRINSSDPAGTARASWLTYYGNLMAAKGARYVALYEYDSTPYYELTTSAELAAWNAFV